ncbi:hypothetical protein MA16_Dca017979 [Dendrobium catenatum]|uniref:Uncharacterized protein n=1 Tax=Dendrobium catenatum TaxID=906689 RepID=A0A2I0W281_9ASPA|nr:hypothetical protein MA16_Dca017979 [Dendrobium catenatum]
MVRVTYTCLFGLKDRGRQETVVGRRPESERPLSVDGGRKDHSRRQRPEEL